ATARVVLAVCISLGRNSKPGSPGSVRWILHPLQRANLGLVDADGIFRFAWSHGICRVERQVRWKADGLWSFQLETDGSVGVHRSPDSDHKLAADAVICLFCSGR